MIDALRRVNPLAKYGAVLPVFIVVILSKGFALPAAVAGVSVVMLFTLSRQRPWVWGSVLPALPALALLFMFSLAVWTPAPAGEAPLFTFGPVAWHPTSLAVAAATGVRISAILALALTVGLTTDTRALVRSAVQNLRLPHRVGYAALIAFEFVPHLQRELATIRLAHRARYASARRSHRLDPRRVLETFTLPVSLLAGGIRHAERVAIAMETRSFGLHPTRSERHKEPFRGSDWVWFAALLGCYAATVIASLAFTP